MTPQTVVVVAGIPPEIGNEFASRLLKRIKSVVLWTPLGLSDPYTDSYSEKLYDRLAKKLMGFDDWHDRRASVNTRLLVLYLYKNDMNNSRLFKRFGMEALVVPLKSFRDILPPLTTRGQRGYAINKLVEEGYKAFLNAKKLLNVVSEEITNRDNRTCLLLPRKSFGKDINVVFEYVRNSALKKIQSDNFRDDLRRFAKQLPKVRVDRREYFRGKNGIVFKSLSKSGMRHALAPVWKDSAHNASCVIRARLRFGASYAPDFHYDCDIPKHSDLIFSNCHDAQVRIGNREYVNISPNDNIR